MVCERCGQNPVAVVTTAMVEGQKVASFLCTECHRSDLSKIEGPPQLQRPCPKCRQREGTVKFTRYVGERRTVSHLCEACARAMTRT